MRYTQISTPIMCDLLDCKSKVEDMKLLVEEYALQLKALNMLDRLAEILYSVRYDPNNQDLIEELTK